MEQNPVPAVLHSIVFPLVSQRPVSEVFDTGGKMRWSRSQKGTLCDRVPDIQSHASQYYINENLFTALKNWAFFLHVND